ncbi:hypothetical protein K504DRAFT_448622 [Pleomassaria siparia CBS 279.74]|uniref:Uncharacterized protein n=1 Tax=Pleomassaria siparia CBS 279.74 TaxID=1314801 RepID=A0A6G1JY76_9PLEO|nr:hypothetical protein K504DRAFT_448622 [Pleomassaria siparia CBS 279.74]
MARKRSETRKATGGLSHRPTRCTPVWTSIVGETNKRLKAMKKLQKSERKQRRHHHHHNHQPKRKPCASMNATDVGGAKKHAVEEAFSLGLLSPRRSRKAGFSLLNLPRELRNQIYEQVFAATSEKGEGQKKVGNLGPEAHTPPSSSRHIPPSSSQQTPNSPVHDSISTHAKQQLHQRDKANTRSASAHLLREHRTTGRTALLATNHQVYAEALPYLYTDSNFIVHLDPDTNVFAARAYIQRTPPTKDRATTSQHKNVDHHSSPAAAPRPCRAETTKAIPFGWNVSLITNLVLRIDLGVMKKADLMNNFSWPVLSQMISLRRLRIIVTYWKLRPSSFVTSLIYGHDTSTSTSPCPDNAGSEGSVEYQNMMSGLFRELPNGVREVTFGAPGGKLRPLFGLDLASYHTEADQRFLELSARRLDAFMEWERRVNNKKRADAQ